MSKAKREQAIKATLSAAKPAGVQVSHYPPGEAPDSFDPGDFSLHRAGRKT